jgi:hypothetical protein
VEEIKVGDRVTCRLPGSWVDGKAGVVTRLAVVTSDGVRGHMVQMPGCVTVVEPEHLERAE